MIITKRAITTIATTTVPSVLTKITIAGIVTEKKIIATETATGIDTIVMKITTVTATATGTEVAAAAKKIGINSISNIMIAAKTEAAVDKIRINKFNGNKYPRVKNAGYSFSGPL